MLVEDNNYLIPSDIWNSGGNWFIYLRTIFIYGVDPLGVKLVKD